MRLHENWELFSDALQAASQPEEDGGLGIKSIFIEKDYWICRSLSLMAANDKDNRAIFKGGTSLTKAYGIGCRFSEDIDIAISEAQWKPVEDADQKNSQKHDGRTAGNGYAWFYKQRFSLPQGILFLSKNY